MSRWGQWRWRSRIVGDRDEWRVEGAATAEPPDGALGREPPGGATPASGATPIAGDGRPARPRRALSQQLAPGQAGIAQPALRVQDPQLRRPPGRPEAIPRHADLCPLPHHVSPQPDPRPPAQLQPQRGDLGQGAGQGGPAGPAARARAAGRRPSEPAPPAGRSRSRQRRGRYPGSHPGPGTAGPAAAGPPSVLEEHRRHRQRLLERARRQDDQPVQLHAPGHGLDRIQAPGQVQVGGYPARGLGLGDGPQRQRGLAAGAVAVEGRGRGARQPAQTRGSHPGPGSRWVSPDPTPPASRPACPAVPRATSGPAAAPPPARLRPQSPRATVRTPQRGAAPPQRSRRDDRAAWTFGGRGRPWDSQ